MFRKNIFLIGSLISAFAIGNVFSKALYVDPIEGFEFTFNGKISTGTNFDLWSNLLNHDVPEDRVFANRMGLDGIFNIITPTVKGLFNLRTKAVWGNNKTVKTSSTQLKDDGGYLQMLDEAHMHTVNLPGGWFREVWFEVDLTRAFDMTAPFHSLTIGSFPFQVGRGIALGDVYAFNPGTLGFYTDGTVDQYAYGAKLTGGFFKKLDFNYDLYTAVLQNNCTSLAENLARTQTQAFDRRPDSARGFGKVNWLSAIRLNIIPIKNDISRLKFEPYVVFNLAPEQTIEFFADSKSKLTTIGMAIDGSHSNWEGGVDGAMNFGHQVVKGWDRNHIERLNINGVATYVYSDVYTVDPVGIKVNNAQKLVYNPANTSTTKAVNSVTRSIVSNGTEIPGTTYYNSVSRFRAPYQNEFKGYMFVGDLGYWLYKKDLRIAMTAGVASGDMNPNANLADPLSSKVDGDYKGFISLQELYAGKLVKSVFVMGGSKKLVRPLSTPPSGDMFSAIVDSFSNLIFTGVSLNYAKRDAKTPITINPNLLVYWEQAPGNKFDIKTGLTTDQKAASFLGTEFNIVSRGTFSENVIIDCMFALFQPGAHYNDVEGQPFNASQRKQLDAYDPQDLPDNLPILWNDTAYSFATGLTYSF